MTKRLSDSKRIAYIDTAKAFAIIFDGCGTYIYSQGAVRLDMVFPYALFLLCIGDDYQLAKKEDARICRTKSESLAHSILMLLNSQL